jgi:hypothetical protein
MAYSTAGNVLRATASGDIIPGPVRTKTMEINNPSGGAVTVTLTKATPAGASNAAAVLFSDEIPAGTGKNYVVNFKVGLYGIFVTMSGAGATVFLYSK